MVLRHISDHYTAQPKLAELAAVAGLSERQLHAIFVQWAGVTPKQFLASITKNHAKALLHRQSIEHTSIDLGLSSPSRLHDLFVKHEAMTPAEFKSGGRGLLIDYGFYDSPFGEMLVMGCDRGLTGLAFCDNYTDRQTLIHQYQARLPNARIQHNESRHTWVNEWLWQAPLAPSKPISVLLAGTPFQLKVWEALLAIAPSERSSYGQLAEAIGSPNAARAVGSAVGRNPISILIPCHRVIQQSGMLGGYAWGLERKLAIQGWELNAPNQSE